MLTIMQSHNYAVSHGVHVCMFAPCYSLRQPCIVYVVVVLVLSLWCTEYDATMAWHASLYITHEWQYSTYCCRNEANNSIIYIIVMLT
jgi:hypothetical protein